MTHAPDTLSLSDAQESLGGVDSRHKPGTARPRRREPQGRAMRAADQRSAVPGWPRLLSIEQASAYVNLSVWSLRELINDGTIPTVRIPRAQTLRMRQRGAVSSTVRRLLIDRVDLDRLVER